MSEDSSNNIQLLLHKQAAKMDFMEKQNEQLIWLIKGNKNLHIKGLAPSVEDLQQDVREIKVWKDGLWKLDLKKLVSKETVNIIAKIFIWSIGLGGGVFGVIKILTALIHG